MTQGGLLPHGDSMPRPTLQLGLITVQELLNWMHVDMGKKGKGKNIIKIISIDLDL